MTPKQAAAKLLLNNLDHGKVPSQMPREEIAEILGGRISDAKREKILQFVEKIGAPFRERLTRIVGEAPSADEAAAAGDE